MYFRVVVVLWAIYIDVLGVSMDFKVFICISEHNMGGECFDNKKRKEYYIKVERLIKITY